MDEILRREIKKERLALRRAGWLTNDWPGGTFAQHAGECLALVQLSGDREQIREELVKLLAFTQAALEAHDANK